jgi:hypothetical protein
MPLNHAAFYYIPCFTYQSSPHFTYNVDWQVGKATLSTAAQNFQSVFDLNARLLVMCVPLNWVSFGMSLLRELSQCQSRSGLLKGNLRSLMCMVPHIFQLNA